MQNGQQDGVKMGQFPFSTLTAFSLLSPQASPLTPPSRHQRNQDAGLPHHPQLHHHW